LESLQLAERVADENRKHYIYFTAEQMQKLLQLFRESCLAILQEGTDPIGYL
jgi:hypothetical protein